MQQINSAYLLDNAIKKLNAMTREAKIEIEKLKEGLLIKDVKLKQLKKELKNQ